MIKHIVKFIKMAILAGAVAPIAIAVVAFVASFFIPVGTYLPEDLDYLKTTMHFVGRDRPMISTLSSGRAVAGRDPVVFSGVNLADTVRT